MNANNQLTDWQRIKLCEVIRMGCDRTTACDYVGITAAQLEAEMQRDEEFARLVVRNDAEIEMQHMGNVYKAARSEKNWRTSVWWLERRAHDRAEGREQSPAEDHVAELVDHIARIIVTLVSDVDVHRHLIERLYHVVARDDRADDAPSACEPPMLLAPSTADSASPAEDSAPRAEQSAPPAAPQLRLAPGTSREINDP